MAPAAAAGDHPHYGDTSLCLLAVQHNSLLAADSRWVSGPGQNSCTCRDTLRPGCAAQQSYAPQWEGGCHGLFGKKRMPRNVLPFKGSILVL